MHLPAGIQVIDASHLLSQYVEERGKTIERSEIVRVRTYPPAREIV
jgi:hypothetical protein